MLRKPLVVGWRIDWGKERVGRSPVKKPHLYSRPYFREVTALWFWQWQYRHVLWGLVCVGAEKLLEGEGDLKRRYDHLGGQQFHD